LSDGAEFVELGGERVLLRDPRPEDVEARLRWVTTETAWQDWDAPWEGPKIMPPERIDERRQAMLESIAEPLPTPRSSLYVELPGGPLLGWVNSYRHDPVHRTASAGIDICESAFWGQGIGTEALRLWIGYLFTELDLHRVGLETWSGNQRMIRCAEKCGFVEEGRFRENVEYRGGRYDGVKLGLLRREWEARPNA